MNVLMTPCVKNQKPDQFPQEDQSLDEDQNPQMVNTMLIPVLMLLVWREITRDMYMSVIPQIIIFLSPQRISLPINLSTLTPYYETKCIIFNAPFLIWCSRDDELFATPSDVGGEEKELISYVWSGLQSCSKRLKNLLET